MQTTSIDWIDRSLLTDEVQRAVVYLREEISDINWFWISERKAEKMILNALFNFLPKKFIIWTNKQ